MLFVFTLSFVKLLWPFLRFSSCTPNQHSRTPTNKMLTLTLRVTQKQVFFCPPNKYSIYLSWVFLSKVFIYQKEYGAILKKERDIWSSQNSKRKDEKEWNTWRFQSIEKSEIAHTFKAIIKREKVMIKGVPKILGLEKIYIPHTLAHLDQSVWLASPWIWFLT